MLNNLKKVPAFILRILTEFFQIWFIRILNIKTYTEYLFEKKDEIYSINPKKIYKINRKDGISGFYRVKNEEKFIEISVLSHLPYLDEIIIVYNDCSDKTPEIIKKLVEKYPEKIKAYEYKPYVNPPLSYKHILTPSRSIHSLANYYNFTLSKITKKIAIKIDADHIPVIENFKNAINNIRKNNINTMNYFYGVNIYIEDNKTYINDKKPFTYGLDCGFFPISKNTYFVNRKDSESMKLPFKMYFSRKSLGLIFYHLKGMKDIPKLDSKNKEYVKEIKDIIDITYNPNLISWEKAKEKYSSLLKDTPDPVEIIDNLKQISKQS